MTEIPISRLHRASLASTVLLACLLACLPGCATCLSQGAFIAGRAPDNMWHPDSVIYGGTRIWIDAAANISESWTHDPLATGAFVAVGLLDVPLSIVADSALLPLTVIEHLAR